MRRPVIDRICFIGGYQIDKVRQAFRHNTDWQNNNILASLFYAEDLMDGPFICCYADILFTPSVIERLLSSDEDIALVVDTDWLSRYEHRSEHPTYDAEKVIARDGVIIRIHRDIADQEAHGEFIGVAKFSAGGAARLRQHHHRCRQRYARSPFREAAVFEEAFLIQLLQEMIEAGERMVHIDTRGGYIEVDTQELCGEANYVVGMRHSGSLRSIDCVGARLMPSR
ncbi:phosphocholine cytidylyltransferase family protein [Acidobacteria bacterium AH-259-O06]|nr:phosphocholine cytidylyltransferase family protein [Acidobacteria bacterium AH-259-O06]